MPVKKDPSGRRSVEAEVEVPGTPDDVWKAIASGPGITSWFVPSTVEEHVDGAAVSNFGPGMESVAKIKLWEPPRRFVAESVEGPGTIATEWTVEARAGGSCVVRVVHRWFASTDDWDNQFEGHTYGWQAFFRILRLYLMHFRGEPCAAIQLTGFAPGSVAEAWNALIGKLGMPTCVVGQRVSTGSGAPLLAGMVERVGPDAYPELLLRLDEPGRGIAHLFGMPMGGVTLLSIRLYLYGVHASVTAADPSWQAWVHQHFPALGAGTA